MSTKKTLKVLSANCCIFPSGLRNRPLAFLTLGSICTVDLLFVALHRRGLRESCLEFVALFFVLAFGLGIILARLGGGVLALLNRDYQDFKRERILLLIQFVADQDCDVLCVQECFDSWLLPSRHVQFLVERAKTIGFHHVAPSTMNPSLSTITGMTNGLLIFSKIPIRSSTTAVFRSQVWFERMVVDRGALHCELEGEIHVFTCHLSPDAENCGPLKYCESSINGSRFKQAAELAAFIRRQAEGTSRCILMGDLNLSIQFHDGTLNPKHSLNAERILTEVRVGASMTEMTSACRGKDVGDSKLGSLAHFLPTCGYTGADCESGGPPELFLSSFIGDGTPKHICEDAVLFRGLTPISIEELPMLIDPGKRPHPNVTHITDHWSLLATFGGLPN